MIEQLLISKLTAPKKEIFKVKHELPQKYSSLNKINTHQNFAPSENSSAKSNKSKGENVYNIAAFDTQNKIKDNTLFSRIYESPDEFIDHFVEGQETN